MPMIHNRGRVVGDKNIARKIVFPKGWDDEGMPLKEGKKILTETLKPGEHKKVTDEQLAHLKENFGEEILNLDSMKEMQGQFKERAPEKSREGYVAPDEVDAIVAKRVAEELARHEAGKQDKRDVDGDGTDSREQLIARLDAMDRGDLIAFIEKEGLKIEHKNFKAPNSLKAAILSAIENKYAAKEAA